MITQKYQKYKHPGCHSISLQYLKYFPVYFSTMRGRNAWLDVYMNIIYMKIYPLIQIYERFISKKLAYKQDTVIPFYNWVAKCQ